MLRKNYSNKIEFFSSIKGFNFEEYCLGIVAILYVEIFFTQFNIIHLYIHNNNNSIFILALVQHLPNAISFNCDAL